MTIVPPSALKPRKTPTQTRATVTVDAIYKATIQVLLAEGISRLTTTRIAERAGVSVGTLYQYFPHKQALLYALVKQHLTEFAEEFDAICQQHQQSTLESMIPGIVGGFLDIKIRQPEVTQALYKIAAQLDTDTLRMETAKRLQQSCANLLASARNASFDKVSDLAFTLMTAMNGTTRAVFEFGLQPDGVALLRSQLLLLSQGFLQRAAQLAQESSATSPEADASSDTTGASPERYR
jgi:AcrR family transcriptional regulator